MRVIAKPMKGRHFKGNYNEYDGTDEKEKKSVRKDVTRQLRELYIYIYINCGNRRER